MEIRRTCPLGSECEVARDGHVERCRWYQEYAGSDTVTGEEKNYWECSMAMMPILQLESAKTNRSIAAAVESARNVNHDNQQQALNLVKQLGLK